jgi:glycosyltransferase involved in cell wall biosynthesis
MTASPPLVSVIMNCYNGERFLREAIDSVYQQSYQDWEIIFWDNASIDNSAEIALSYDGRLKYFKSESTTTLGEARVLAVDKAQGKYIAFLDCDDLWYPQKLLKQIEAINNNLGFVYCKADTIIERNSHVLKATSKALPNGLIFPSLAKRNFIPFVSVLMPIKVYNECGGFPKNYKNSTDYYLFLKIEEKYKIHAVQKAYCAYRIHSNNLSHKQRIIGAQESIDAVSSFIPNKAALDGLKYQYADLAIAHFKEKKFWKFFSLVFHSEIFFILLKKIHSKYRNIDEIF